MIQEYDYEFKIILIGNAGVGKSSLLLRFTDDSFSDAYLTTIGVDFRIKTLPIDGKIVKLQIWDTAGQERFRTVTSSYYKGADAIAMVYDVTNTGSFEDVDKHWISEVEQFAKKDCELLLIGNKSDLDTRTFYRVSTEQGIRFAKSKNMGFVEASAKTSEQVDAVFNNLARILKKKKDEQETQ